MRDKQLSNTRARTQTHTSHARTTRQQGRAGLSGVNKEVDGLWLFVSKATIKAVNSHYGAAAAVVPEDEHVYLRTRPTGLAVSVTLAQHEAQQN